MVRRSTWILLGVLSVLVVAYLAWRRDAPAETEPPTAVAETLWTVPSEQIDTVRIIDLQGNRMVLARRDPEVSWRLQYPVVGAGDSAAIEMGVASLASPSVRQRIAVPSDLAAFGLDPAAYRVTLILRDGTARSADVGGLDPTGSVFYVLLPGADEVVMVSRFALEDALGLLAETPLAQPTVGPTGTP
jgi:hypothetical protein